MNMRALLVVVLALGILWGGYWVAGSTALQKAAESWFAAQVEGGLDAGYSDLKVQGFPNRFDLTVTDLHLADPVSGFGWDAPFAQVFSMTWKPWHLIAALPNSQTITAPDQQITLGSSSLMASLEMTPDTSLALDSLIVEGKDINASSTIGWVLGAERVQIATRQNATKANAHQITVTIDAPRPDPALVAALAATSDLPPVLDQLTADVIAGFSAPLDRSAAQSNPRLLSLDLTGAHIGWGTIKLNAKGSLIADADGLAEGRIDISVQDWRKLLPVILATGLVTPEVAPTVENMMELMAQQSGDPAIQELALIMKAGWMTLGPLPLGPAPRFHSGPMG